jgi:hypothetical protein
MEVFKHRRDGGRRAFALPMELSSRARSAGARSALSMRDWLLAQGFDSPHLLHWYVDYACRDDYGTAAPEVSAWAGIHYFACRNGEAQDAANDTVLTTPGGNAWLADGLAQLDPCTRRRAPDARCDLAFRVAEADEAWMHVDLWLPAEKRSVRAWLPSN